MINIWQKLPIINLSLQLGPWPFHHTTLNRQKKFNVNKLSLLKVHTPYVWYYNIVFVCVRGHICEREARICTNSVDNVVRSCNLVHAWPLIMIGYIGSQILIGQHIAISTAAHVHHTFLLEKYNKSTFQALRKIVHHHLLITFHINFVNIGLKFRW